MVKAISLSLLCFLVVSCGETAAPQLEKAKNNNSLSTDLGNEGQPSIVPGPPSNGTYDAYNNNDMGTQPSQDPAAAGGAGASPFAPANQQGSGSAITAENGGFGGDAGLGGGLDSGLGGGGLDSGLGGGLDSGLGGGLDGGLGGGLDSGLVVDL